MSSAPVHAMPKRPRYFHSFEDDVKRWARAAALLAGFTVLHAVGSLLGFVQP